MAAFDYIPCDFWDMEDEPSGAREPYDPLYYHTMIRFERIVEKNRRFWVLEIARHGIVYVPKSICQHMKKKKRTVWVHRKTYESILQRQRTTVDLLPDLGDEDE